MGSRPQKRRLSPEERKRRRALRHARVKLRLAKQRAAKAQQSVEFWTQRVKVINRETILAVQPLLFQEDPQP